MGDRQKSLAWLLFLVSVFNFVDRQILTILAEPIRIDLDLTDSQLGLLTGLAFGLFYALAGIPVARIIDRPNVERTKLLSLGLAFWTLMTMGAGLAQNFLQLLILRMGVGLGEATCAPTAHAIIGDFFAPERRSRAVAQFGLGVPAGTLLGLTLGGLAADLFGWRLAFIIVGAPGLLLSAALWMFRDVRSDAKPSVSDNRVGGLLQSPAYVMLISAIATTAFVTFGQGLWTAVLLIRGYGLSAGTVGVWLGIVSGTAGLAGTWLGGVMGDRLGRESPRGRLFPCTMSLLLVVPLDLIAFNYAQSPQALLALLWFPLMLLSVMYGPAFAAVQAMALPSQRGIAAAVALLASNVVGLGLGPFIYGVVSQAIGGGDPSGIRWALCAGGLFAIVPASLFWLAGRSAPASPANPGAA